MKVTPLSKWTVLLLTAISIALAVFGVLMWRDRAFGLASNTIVVILAFVVAVIIYVIAWFVGLFDSIQERRFGWTVALLLLSPFFIGPLLYSVIGPKNTK